MCKDSHRGAGVYVGQEGKEVGEDGGGEDRDQEFSLQKLLLGEVSLNSLFSAEALSTLMFANCCSAHRTLPSSRRESEVWSLQSSLMIFFST